MSDQEKKYVHKASSGSLFKNQYKEKDSQPDYKGGCCTPDGVQWELAGWVSTTQSGDKYISIKLQTPYVKEEESSEPVAKAVSNDLPF
tara:strand:- start:402 stop:665 length:264 start_codon:yes stop_codon:yes gene_type:complete